jgi:glycosyltransferase involved in cell wall biosynthesis
MSTALSTASEAEGESPPGVGVDSVAVVITTYNHAHFLAAAIQSGLQQSIPPAEMIVVDDGSTDDVPAVVSRFPMVTLIQQTNQGLSAARNTGLHAAKSRYILFLDADDLLRPNAIEAGLACFAQNRDAGFVYGGHIFTTREGTRLGPDTYLPIGPHAYQSFLQRNVVGMHATVLYDRQKLLAVGGFDTTLPRCEDYDVYLRMSRQYSVASHPAIVAHYCWHGGNMSLDHAAMLATALEVHARQREHANTSPETAAAWQSGRRNWREYYACKIFVSSIKRGSLFKLSRYNLRGICWSLSLSPYSVGCLMITKGHNRLTKSLRKRLSYYLKRVTGRQDSPPVGKVKFGDFARSKPVSSNFGFDRGLPIDRYYIEKFLESKANLIQGRVLEIGDASYSRKYGGSLVTRQDVLHINPDAPDATIIGDMSDPELLEENSFDCMVLTQTLHLIYDMHRAVASIRRALKPGGVALVTVPGITPIDRGEWKESWYWSLTRYSAARMFGEVFGPENIVVGTRGNAFAATAFIQGLAVEEVPTTKLDPTDESLAILVTIVARKPMPS